MTAVTAPVINTEFAIQGESGGSIYPALQATDYKPKSLSTKIQLCFSEDSADKLPQDFSANVPIGTDVVDYGSGEVPIFILPEDIRFVILGTPRMFALDKETKEVTHLQKGVRLADSGLVTTTRIPLCMVYCDKLVMTEDGTPQIVTLKLTSTKTKLLEDRRDPEWRSIAKLNEGLLKHYKMRRCSLTHLVSVQLLAIANKFSSAKNPKDVSIGVLFALGEGARALSPDQQQILYHLVQSEEVKDLLKDPFGLARNVESVGKNPLSEAELDEIGF